MELKKITLINIRSYERQTIEFPSGSTLLSGDIGSGKTSILLGIEFGLFGLQPGQRGHSILKNGKKEGGVILEFEVDGKGIIIERTLKRGKSVSQDYCSVSIEGEKKEIAVTELKNLVLDLLNYPKEFSKKQNMLYKFTVYTPQEEMKQIVLQDTETRVNTLRHVFGIDKYKRIIENISILASKLREEKRIKEGITINLEQDKLDLISKEEELESRRYNLVSVEKDFFIKSENRKRIQEEKEEIFKKVEEKIKLQQEIEKTKISISHKNNLIADNLRVLAQIKLQIKELEVVTFNESQIPQLEFLILELKKRKKEFDEKNLEVSSSISSLSLKTRDNEDLKNKLKNMEICPTCLQDVGPVYKSNVENKLHSDNFEIRKKINQLVENKKQIQDYLLDTEHEISKREKEVQELRMLKIKAQGIAEKKLRLEEIEKTNFSLIKDLELLSQHLELLKKSVFDLNKFDNIFQEKIKELEFALKEEKLAEIEIAELKKEIKVFSRYIESSKEKIRKSEEVRGQLQYLNDLESWIAKKFIPLISFIEKNVMTKLKSEFSSLFERWFYMLVSDSFNARLSDDFSPIIEQQDYEIDYAYLSGGERTAVALAYRLALNQVINSLLSRIKTRDVVILDEPTDGFSEQQLDKMRDVLQQLNVNQLIIVSHEQKIESFVENVIKFKKENGISKIE